MEEVKPLSPSPPPAAKLVRSSVMIYGVMFVVGFEICWWFHKNTLTLFDVVGVDWYQAARVTIVGISFLTLGQHCLEEFFPSYRRLKMTFAQLFRGLTTPQVFLLATLSSFGEEMLFRGAMQPYLGVWATAAIFALMHIDPEGRLSIWTLWAFLGGIVMGLAVEVTGSLWPAIFIHFGVNAISIHRVVRLSARQAVVPGPTPLSSGPKP